MVGFRRIRRSLEGKGVEWNGDGNVDHVWEQIKLAILESAREVCGSVRVGGKNPKCVWWNDEIKATVRRKSASDETKDVWKPTAKRKVKRCIIQNKKKVNEHFGRKMKEDVNGNRKLIWKVVSNAKGGELQQSKGWKWEVGRGGGGRSEKDLEVVF